jgi:hypothetical protein
MASSFPDWLVDIIGYDQLEKFPVLDLGDKVGMTDYIDFVRLEDVTAPVMRGVDVYRRPFLTLRVINRKTGKLSVHTIFQRYTDCVSPWCCGTRYERIVETCLRESEKEFLTRLFKHESCGANQPYGEEDKTTDKGESVIELC